MNKSYGLLLSEFMTILILLVAVVAVGFGLYVNSERNDVVESAEASLVTAKAKVAEAVESGAPLVCDNSIFEPEPFSSEYFSLAITPVSLGKAGPGFAPGVVIDSHREEDGNDAYVISKRLLSALMKDDKFVVNMSEEDDDDIAYTVLLSDNPVCANPTAAS